MLDLVWTLPGGGEASFIDFRTGAGGPSDCLFPHESPRNHPKHLKIIQKHLEIIQKHLEIILNT